MPIYEFECTNCGVVDDLFSKIEDRPLFTMCKECGHVSYRIISKVAVHGEEASWINDDLRNSLQKDGEKPIETRTEYKKYLKDNNIIEKTTGLGVV